MTEKDIKNIREQIEFANTIKDDHERQKAFTLISQQKNELLLDCFRKQSERIKQVVADIEVSKKDRKLLNDKLDILTEKIETFSSSMKPLQQCYLHHQEINQQKKGMLKLLKIGKVILAAGGGAALLKVFEIVCQFV
jgi:hypothetical protein